MKPLRLSMEERCDGPQGIREEAKGAGGYQLKLRIPGVSGAPRILPHREKGEGRHDSRAARKTGKGIREDAAPEPLRIQEHLAGISQGLLRSHAN